MLNNFPLIRIFLCYQTLENMKNYLCTRFSIKINGAKWQYKIKYESNRSIEHYKSHLVAKGYT